MSDQEPLFLPEANLQCDEGFLTRTDEDGKQILKISLDSIKSVRSRKKFGAFGGVLVAAAAAIAWIGYEIPDNITASVFFYFIGVVLGVFGMLGVIENRIVFETDNGPLAVSTTDGQDVIDGFIFTLREQLKLSS